MATSQNGWVVRTSSSGLAPLSWITGRVLPGDVFTIFDFLCKKFNATVEPIRRDQSWGWAYRVVRGGSDLSNHASATAIDLNAPSHPLGRRGTFSPDQNRAIQRILNDLDAVVRWGGDYPGRPDEMHFEINASAQRVAAVADRIRKGTAGGGGSAPAPGGGGSSAPSPTPTPEEEDDMPTAAEVANAVLNTPDAALGGRTVHQVLSSLVRVPTDVDTVNKKMDGVVTDSRDAVLEGRARAKTLAGIVIDARDAANGAKALPGITIDARDSVLGNREIIAQVAGLKVALDTLAAGQGLDPAAVTAAVDAGVSSALARIETTVSVKPEASK